MDAAVKSSKKEENVITLRGAKLVEIKSGQSADSKKVGVCYLLSLSQDKSFGITAKLVEKVDRIVEDLQRLNIEKSAIKEVALPSNAGGQVASNLRSIIRRKIGEVNFLQLKAKVPDLKSEKLPRVPPT